MKALIAFIAGLIALPLVFVLVAIAGHLPSNSTSAPPHWEASLGMRALDASLEKRSDGLTNPVAANDVAAAAQGQAIYAHDCAGCHGSSKGPSQWGANGLLSPSAAILPGRDGCQRAEGLRRHSRWYSLFRNGRLARPDEGRRDVEGRQFRRPCHARQGQR